MSKENFSHSSGNERESKKEGQVPLSRAILARGVHENIAIREAVLSKTGVVMKNLDLPGTAEQGMTAIDKLLSQQNKSGSQKRFPTALAEELDSNACQTYIRKEFTHRERVTPENAKEHVQELARAHVKMYPKTTETVDLIVGFTTKAEEISEEEGVTPDVVYLNHELFKRLIRESTSPEEIATENVAHLKSFTSEKMKEIKYDTIRSTIGLFVPEATPEVLDSAVQDVVTDDYWLQAESDTAQIKDSVRVYTKEAIERYWGAGAFEQLDPSLRHELDRDRDPRNE
jgi:hypothetical protein